MLQKIKHNLIRTQHSRGETAINDQIQGTFESKISVLQKKIKKKDELIKYLQRKCGQQIIKSTRKIYQKIAQLEKQNRNLKAQKLNARNCDSQNQKLTDILLLEKQLLQAPFSNLSFSGLSQPELQRIILFQASEIQKLLSKIEAKDKILEEYSKNSKYSVQKTLMEKFGKNTDIVPTNKSHRKHSSLSRQNFLDIMSNENTPDSLSKINILNNSVNSCLSECKIDKISDASLSRQIKNEKKPKNLKRHPQIQQIQSIIFTSVQSQTDSQETYEQYAQTQQDLLSTYQLFSQNQILKCSNQSLLQKIETLEQELQLSKQKIQILQDKANDQDCTTILEEKEPSKEIHNVEYYQPKTEIQINYLQLLDIFCIEWDEYENEHEVHEMLLTEINNLKKQLGKMLREFRKLQKEIEDLYQEKEQIERGLEYQKNMNTEMNDFIGVIAQQLQFSNEEIMRNKIVAHNDKIQRMQEICQQENTQNVCSDEVQKHQKTRPQQQQQNQTEQQIQ